MLTLSYPCVIPSTSIYKEAKINIFYLSRDPIQAAQWHCDKHVVKMPLELAQMLCTSHRKLDGVKYTLDNKFLNKLFYRATHANHPMTEWVSSSDEHYRWAYEHWIALCIEYNARYEKAHKSWRTLADYLVPEPKNIAKNGFTDPPKCVNFNTDNGLLIPPEDAVYAYREYYKHEKMHLHQWKRNKPDWI